MLFDPAKSQFFVLNSTMAYLWRNCDGEKSLDRIVESVCSDFDGADAHPIAAEMKTALDELTAAHDDMVRTARKPTVLAHPIDA